MDITKLDINDIELFAMANDVAEAVFGVKPMDASEKKRKKIRKWVNRTYLDEEVPQNVLDLVGDAVSDTDFFELLAVCSDYVKEHGTEKQKSFEKAVKDFPEEVKSAFTYLFETMGYCETFEKQDDNLVLLLDEDYTYKRQLILHGVGQFDLARFDSLNFSDAQFLKEENGYQLIFTEENYEEEISVPVTIFFENASVTIEIYRADCRDFEDTPFETLAFMASDILSKQTLGDQYLNPKERELIPLLQELRLLSSFAFVVQQDGVDFHNIKDYIRKYHLTRLLPLLEKVEAGYRKQSVGALALSRLMTQLNDKKCESLWRELYGLIVASQQEYPQKTCTYDGEKLKRIRKQIEEKFHALGYIGQYPDFCKQGAIKGVKLEESYHLTYFLACEKNVKYMIHCTETLWGEDLHIEFLCGTAMLKKQETVTDIYSCCFNAKGKRLFKRVICSEEDLEQVEEFVQIAAKRAQCDKLKKHEKELCGVISFTWKYFVFMFLFTGGLFALLMTAAMFLVCCLVTVVIAGPHELLGMIKEMPWGLLFAISFFGFGGGMTFVEMKAKNK